MIHSSPARSRKKVPLCFQLGILLEEVSWGIICFLLDFSFFLEKNKFETTRWSKGVVQLEAIFLFDGVFLSFLGGGELG
jgi:hypothetical protein